MLIEPIGIITFIIGLLCLLRGPDFTTIAFTICTLLGAAAGVLLTSFGGGNLPPAHILLAFVIIDVLRRPNLLHVAITELRPPKAGFWLGLLILYSIPTAIILPRLFAGMTYVFAVRSDAGISTILQVPLAPSSGNYTQTIYLIGDLFIFLCFRAYMDRPDHILVLARALIATASFNIAFGLLDIVTYATNTTETIAFMRNASYRMLTDVELAGIKRIVGSFAEASSFASMSCILFAFTSSLWLRNVYTRFAGIAALGNLVFILLSTSTTGYVSLLFITVVQFLYCLSLLIQRASTLQSISFLLLTPLIIGLFVSFIAAHEATRVMLHEILDATILNKLDSDSGIERASWNRQAMSAFWDTYGIGAGVGSVRASSWWIVVPASVGVVGAVTYWAFLWCILWVRSTNWSTQARIQGAVRVACATQIVTVSISGALMDLGPLFFILAAGAVTKIPGRKNITVSEMTLIQVKPS